ncbi:hypothetical protein VTJ04DRAFT_4619 [Mycothermus thermophilus]|uniref:uncharacterized protein n=1 Tax=Humicola insolens TaxID=85995 RepID=UPI003741F948
MSVFDVLKKGRQAAKEHKQEQAKKKQEEAKKPPYRHIPKHAAIDAMACAPAGWREQDRQRIAEENRRRSAMGSVHGSTTHLGALTPPFRPSTLPRVHSSLSHVSYPSAYADPVVRVPRNHSLGSIPPRWNRETMMNYSAALDATGLAASSSRKGKEVERVLMDRSYRTSRSSSKMSVSSLPVPPIAWAYSSPSSSSSSSAVAVPGVANFSEAPSPAESSSTSTSSGSQEDLQMKPVVRHVDNVDQVKPTPTPEHRHTPSTATDRDGTESLHRLHPRTRRVSDANQSSASSTRSFSLAPKVDVSADVPPVPILPPTEVGAAITTPDPIPGLAISPGLELEEDEGSEQTDFVTAESSSDVSDEQQQQPQDTITPTPETLPTSAPPKPITAVPTPPLTSSLAKPNGPKRLSKQARFSELEPIKSHTTVTITADPPSPKDKKSKKAEKKSKTLPTEFDESALPAPKAIDLPPFGGRVVSTKSGKLTKSPSPQAAGKLVKKNRWSLFGNKSTAVAV